MIVLIIRTTPIPTLAFDVLNNTHVKLYLVRKLL